jgi:hypothetical protein
MPLPINAMVRPMQASRPYRFRQRLRTVLLVLSAVIGSRPGAPLHGPAVVVALRR